MTACGSHTNRIPRRGKTTSTQTASANACFCFVKIDAKLNRPAAYVARKIKSQPVWPLWSQPPALTQSSRNNNNKNYWNYSNRHRSLPLTHFLSTFFSTFLNHHLLFAFIPYEFVCMRLLECCAALPQATCIVGSPEWICNNCFGAGAGKPININCWNYDSLDIIIRFIRATNSIQATNIEWWFQVASFRLKNWLDWLFACSLDNFVVTRSGSHILDLCFANGFYKRISKSNKKPHNSFNWRTS